MADKKGGPSCDGCGSPSCEVSYSSKYFFFSFLGKNHSRQNDFFKAKNYCGDCYRKKINKQPLPKEMKKKPPAPKSATLCKFFLKFLGFFSLSLFSSFCFSSYEDLVRHGRILGRIGWRHVAVFCVRGLFHSPFLFLQKKSSWLRAISS